MSFSLRCSSFCVFCGCRLATGPLSGIRVPIDSVTHTTAVVACIFTAILLRCWGIRKATNNNCLFIVCNLIFHICYFFFSIIVMNGVLPHGNRNRRQFGLVDDDRWHAFCVHMFLCWLGCYALCCQTREDDANDQLKNGLKIQNNFFVRIIKSHIATTTTKPLWVWAMYIINRRSASVKISLVHHHLAIEITRER